MKNRVESVVVVVVVVAVAVVKVVVEVKVVFAVPSTAADRTIVAVVAILLVVVVVVVVVVVQNVRVHYHQCVRYPPPLRPLRRLRVPPAPFSRHKRLYPSHISLYPVVPFHRISLCRLS